MMKKKLLFLSMLFALCANAFAQYQREVSIPIKQASDDIEEVLAEGYYNGETDFNSSDLELGSEEANNKLPLMVAVRFQNLPVPRNRKISNARIEFVLDDTKKTTDPFKMKIWAEDADSTATFNGTKSVLYSVTSRKKLADFVEWTIPEKAFNKIGERYATADISSLLQQLVNRANWKPGNAVTFFIAGEGTREVESFEGSPADAATLKFSYEQTEEEFTNDKEIKQEGEKFLSELTKDLKESDYNIPSWTNLLRAKAIYKKTYIENYPRAKAQLTEVVEGLENVDMPYSINMTIYDDATSNMGFTWYTNATTQPKGKVQIVKSATAKEVDFSTPDFIFDADTVHVNNINYTVNWNGLRMYDIPNNIKNNYISHKALASGLEANTTYSYRVGDEGNWSEIGTFTTAVSRDENEFSFIFIADTQANTEEMFDISAKTIAAARKRVPDARFMLVAGDLVESAHKHNSEWEWEQWFSTNKDVLKSLPVVPVLGNHDVSVNRNFTNHFHTNTAEFDKKMSVTPGSVYSFVYGNTLFIVCSAEDYKNNEIMDKMAEFVRSAGNAHPEVRWKVATLHRGLYTGAAHQFDKYGVVLREKLAPAFDEIGVDVVLQGHDHVYEVAGPIKNHTLVPNSISKVNKVSEGGTYENMTGKAGGVFDVENGTLYFTNNSSGKKKYNPNSKEVMEYYFDRHKVEDYWSLFTGKFGQSGKPTFSDMKITDNVLTFTTYEVDDAGVISEFDSFKVVKTDNQTSIAAHDGGAKVIATPNPVRDRLFIVGGGEIQKVEMLDMTGKVVRTNFADKRNISVSDIQKGIYLLRVSEKNGNVSVHKIVVQK